MKKIKGFLTLFTLICAVTFLSAQQTEKTLVKSFNLKNAQVVVLDLEGEVEIVEWKNKIMRVQMTIAIDKGTESTLKSLIRTGRYNLYSKVDDGDFRVFAPGTRKDFTVSGQQLDEYISYIVYTPENVIVKMGDEASTEVQSPESEPSSL